jgi:hypothetical protein
MGFHHSLHNLRSLLAPARGGCNPRRRDRSLRRAALRLNVEALEDRCLLAFLDPVTYGVGHHPISIVAADFNGDTFMDLAAANYLDDTVSVLAGNGEGGFGPAQTFPDNSRPYSMAAGDFDGDGDQDLATASHYSLNVLRNNGDGTFAAPQHVSLSNLSNEPSVAVGDFNADGKMDLALVSYHYEQTYCDPYAYYCYGTYRGVANVLLGDGSGGFNETAAVPLNSSDPSSVALGDVNNDDKLDLIAGDGWPWYGLEVLLGNGDGTLQAPSHYPTGHVDLSVAVGDLNADGNPDLATAQGFSGLADRAAVLLGNGSGAFPTVNHYASGDNPNAVALADFDRDGRLDLVTSNYSGNISWLRGNGNGSVQAPLTSPAGNSAANATVADFNGDGFPDVAVTNHPYDTVTVVLNDGDWPGPGVPTVTVGDASVIEGHTGAVNASFTVTLSNDPLDTVTIHYATASGSATTADGDYQSAAGTLTFDPGDSLAKTFSVPVNGDRRGETNETFTAYLTSATGAVITDGQGAATIFDDEPRVSIGDAAVTEGQAGTASLSFMVTMSKVYDVDVTVSFVTQDGSATTADYDYQTATGDVVIPAGTTTAPMNVLVNGDTKPEADETLIVTLNSITAVVVDGQGDGVIQNDDDFLTKFYVVDSSADRTYEYQADGQAVENYRLRSGNNDPRGAASDRSGERVWVIDNDDYVYVYDDAGNALGYWKAMGLSTPEGIASDGTDIWVVDRGRDRVYRYAGAASRTSGSVSPTSSFALNSGNRYPKGIETDGGHLWVVNDDKTSKVFKYTLTGSLVGSWTINGNNKTPTGITLDPSNPSDIWIVDSERDQIFQYTAAAGRTSGSQSPSAVFNLASSNSNAQGIADPPTATRQTAGLPAPAAWAGGGLRSPAVKRHLPRVVAIGSFDSETVFPQATATRRSASGPVDLTGEARSPGTLPRRGAGLSKIRKTSAMDGVPLTQRRDQLQCGVAVVNLHLTPYELIAGDRRCGGSVYALSVGVPKTEASSITFDKQICEKGSV